MKKLWLIASLLFSGSFVYADSKVSALPETTTPSTTDYMYIIDNATSKKVQVGNVNAVAVPKPAIYPSTSTAILNYGVNTTTITAGSSTSTSFGNNPFAIFSASGTSRAIQVNINGTPSGGAQNQIGGVTINGPSSPTSPDSPALLVLTDSTTNSTNGAGLLEIWENNPNHNSYLLWIHGSSPRNSDEPVRFDGPTYGIDEVSTSTDAAHGLGKWKVISIANKGVNLQIASSRAWDNSTFENLAYFHPLSAWDDMPGMYLNPQTLTNDSAVLSSSDTSGIGFFTLNSHIVGLTGPQNATASYKFGLPSTVGTQGQVLYHNGNRGGNFNVRQMEWTTGGSPGQVLTYQGTSAPTWADAATASVIYSSMSVSYLGISSATSGGSGISASSVAVSYVGISSLTASNGVLTLSSAAVSYLGISSGTTGALSQSSASVSYFGISSYTFTNHLVTSSQTIIGAQFKPSVLKTSNYTMIGTDDVIFASFTAIGGGTITLPSAINSGQIVEITKVDGSTQPTAIVPAQGQFIVNVGTVVLNAMGARQELISDGGSTWWPHNMGLYSHSGFIGNNQDVASAAQGTSSTTYFQSWNLTSPCAVKSFTYHVTVSTGGGSFGVYDQWGNLRVSTTVAMSGSPGDITSNVSTMTAITTLQPGLYYIATAFTNSATSNGPTVTRYASDFVGGSFSKATTSWPLTQSLGYPITFDNNSGRMYAVTVQCWDISP